MRIFSVLVTAAALMAAMFTPEALAEGGKRVIKLHQEPPALESLDLGAPGATHGDMLAFQAALSGEDGAKAQMFGLLITIDIADGEDTFEDRTGQVHVDFGGGDSIVVAGRSVYAGGEKEMAKGAPQLRAVIGGTGKFIGARGQVTTVRNGDKSYDHVIELIE